MDFDKMMFTIKEIAQATGISVNTLRARAQDMARRGEIDCNVKGKTREYTYDEVLKICRNRVKNNNPRAEYVANLKRHLQNDGYKIKKEG